MKTKYILSIGILILAVIVFPSNVYAHVTDSSCPGGGVGFGCPSPDWFIQLFHMHVVTAVTLILLVFGMFYCIVSSIIKHRTSTRTIISKSQN